VKRDDLTPKQQRQLHSDLCSDARNTQAYQRLTRRRFRNPQGYYRWEDAAIEIAVDCLRRERSGHLLDHKMTQWIDIALEMVAQQGPIYWCDRTFLDSLMRTTVPSEIEVHKSFEVGVFILPENWLKDPAGWSVKYLLVRQFLPDSGTTSNSSNHPFEIVFQTCCGSVHWVNSLDCFQGDDGMITVKTEQGQYIKSIVGEGESLVEENDPSTRFTQTLQLLVSHLLLILNAVPEMVGHESLGKGFQTQKHKAKMNTTDQMLNPRWIGYGFKVQREPISASAGGGTHASPRTHWRCGHWRRVAVGEGRSGRSWRWFKPTLIGK